MTPTSPLPQLVLEVVEVNRYSNNLIIVAEPWITLRERWQTILDGASLNSTVYKQARAQIAYIDETLRRFDGR